MTATLKQAVLVVVAAVTLTGCDSVPNVIRWAFAERGATPTQQQEAVDVAWCESRHVPTARNGQYRGLFQMGNYHNHRPGMQNPYGVLENSIAAADLWAEQGWRPWACRP